jgi:hypothetical protein
MLNVVLVAIITVLAIPLLRNWRESPVVLPALVALFALGFAGPFVNVTGHVALVAIGLAISMGADAVLPSVTCVT